MAEVELRNVTKLFGKVTALNDVSFTVKEGEFFVLLGASGAGKSTAINVISGIESPDHGSVFLNNQDITDNFPQDRDVATAFESYALYPHFTVNQNLLFPLEAPRRKSTSTSEERQKRVKEIAEMLGIDDLLERYPRELSGGQKQRVALGRTLVRSPRIYLLDEPISHLDAKLRHRMRAELRKIQRELGITTLYATPDQLEAMSMGDTIAVLREGNVEQVGTSDEIYYKPRNLYVAQFVGEPPMNILKADFHGSSATVECEAPYQLPIPKKAQKMLTDKLGDAGLLIGIRPKDIRVCPSESAEAHTNGEVVLRDTLGQTSIITMNLKDTTIKAKIDSDDLPELNSRIGLSYNIDRFYYFDATTRLWIG